MSVIQTAPVTPPTPQQQLTNTVAIQQKQMQQLWYTIQNTMNGIASFTYNCPLSNGSGGKFTAQDVFNAWGTDGGDLIKLSNAVLGMLTAYTGSAPQIPPAGVTLTVNGNGTVTVTIAA